MIARWLFRICHFDINAIGSEDVGILVFERNDVSAGAPQVVPSRSLLGYIRP
jgi:hypothetical protein